MFAARSPATTLVYAAYGFVALVAGIIVLALSMPGFGVVFSPSGSAIEMRVAGRPAVSLSPRAPITLSVGADRLTEPADELVADFVPNGARAQISQWYADRSRLVRMGASRHMTLDAPEAGLTGIVLPPRRRSLSALSSDVWLLLLQGAVIGLLGVGIVALRPADRASQIFAVSCGGVVLSAFSGAVFDARELTANGDLLRFAQGVNFIGANLCAAGLLALFLAQPKPLLGRAAPFVLMTLAVASGVVSALGLAPLSLFYGGLALVLPAYPVVLLAQWLASRGDPVARSVIRWVGVTVFSGSAILTIAMTAPQFLGTAPVAGDGWSIVPVFIVYGGIAFGVARFRLFDLDAWAIRLSAGAIGALALLASDAVLILILGVGTPEAFAISVLFVGFLYFPVRHYVWRRLGPRPALSDSALFQAAADVAFTRNPTERQSRWRALLGQLFKPLDVGPGPSVESPFLIEGGLAMALPAAADDSALVLRYRDQGRKLFDASQVRLATELILLMRRAEQTRDDYARGALEERQRIARDLHDDVSARLLTSLHREDIGQIRSDLRKVMSDIRTMVSALSGDRVGVDQALADLRFETAERLEGAKVSLDWPTATERFDDRILTYESYKNLMSSHREVVSNVLRHADATRVTVRVETAEAVLRLTVSDNGRGMSAMASSSGNGLRNIHTRLGLIKGGCEITSGPAGTCVAMAIPVADLD